MIIGEGSISFEIVKQLVKKLPVMTMPRWSITRTQPIGLPDALSYLTASLSIPITRHEIVEIGGPEAMSYKDFIMKYAAWRGRKPLIIRLTWLPETVAAW
jgi:uncharacterized protein YbjT (DUF2867 family)